MACWSLAAKTASGLAADFICAASHLRFFIHSSRPGEKAADWCQRNQWQWWSVCFNALMNPWPRSS